MAWQTPISARGFSHPGTEKMGREIILGSISCIQFESVEDLSRLPADEQRLAIQLLNQALRTEAQYVVRHLASYGNTSHSGIFYTNFKKGEVQG